MEQNNPSTLFMVRSTLQEWTKEKELQTQRIASNNLGQEGYLLSRWANDNNLQKTSMSSNNLGQEGYLWSDENIKDFIEAYLWLPFLSLQKRQ